MLMSKKLFMQPAPVFTSRLFHDVRDSSLLLPSGTYEVELMGSGGQGGGGAGGVGARGQYHKFRFRMHAPIYADVHIGAPGGLSGAGNGGASAGGSAGGDSARPSWVRFRGITESAGFETAFFTGGFTPEGLTEYRPERDVRDRSWVASVWGGGGGGGQGQAGVSGKYLGARQGGAGGGWYYGGSDPNLVDIGANTPYKNPGAVTFVNGSPVTTSVPGKNSGSNGAGDQRWNYSAYGGAGGVSGRDYGANPLTGRTARISGTGSAGANGAANPDNNHNSSFYGGGGGGAGGGPNGSGGAGGTYRGGTTDGENGYNYKTTPDAVTNPLTGESTTTDWGAGGLPGLNNGTWGWIRITKL